MFQRPPYFVTAATFGVLVFLIVLVTGPELWWSRIDPSGYSVHRLTRTVGFVAGVLRDDGHEFGQVQAWRTLAVHRRADSLFKVVFERGTPPARLYALAGLYSIDRAAYLRLRDSVFGDSSRFEVWDPCHGALNRWFPTLGSVVDEDHIDQWTSLLLNAAPLPPRDTTACAA